MIDPSVAHRAHDPTPREERWRAIRERTTRGVLTFNAGGVAHLEGDLWAVRSSRGGFHRVDMAAEECTCEDFAYYGRDRGVACRHVYAVAIAHATRRTHRPAPVPRRVEVFGRLLAIPDCERCGIPAAVETADGVALCEGCAL